LRRKTMFTKIVFTVVAFAVPAVAARADDAKVERGKAVYVEQKCKLCHSIAGEGNAKGALDGVGAKLSKDEISEWLVHPDKMAQKAKAVRKPAMKAYTSLKE